MASGPWYSLSSSCQQAGKEEGKKEV
jgi:hypothetical protein